MSSTRVLAADRLSPVGLEVGPLWTGLAVLLEGPLPLGSCYRVGLKLLKKGNVAPLGSVKAQWELWSCV